MKIGIIHATKNSMPPIIDTLNELEKNIEVEHFLDENLLNEINKQGRVTNQLLNRLKKLVNQALNAQVDGIALSCSSYSPFVKDIQKEINIPIESIDIAMLEAAVKHSTKIGVISTLETAGETTENLLKEIARANNINIEVDTAILTNAAKALSDNKGDLYDQIIQKEIDKLKQNNKIVVMAQLSTNRALKTYHYNDNIPILTSSTYCIISLLDKIEKQQIDE